MRARRLLARPLLGALAALVAGAQASPLQAQEAAARLAPGAPIPPAELEAFVDGVVRESMARSNLAGVTVSVVQRGRAVLEKGYGFADLEANRRVDPAATLFRIGSITKTFTWLMLLEHAAAGRIDLDDPVNEHLPEALDVRDQGYEAPIRLRDLMTHRPGFEDSMLGHLFVEAPARIRPLGAYLAAERVDRVRPPGELSSYSNYGAALAGAVLEQLEGRSWQDALQARILEPLALENTTGREPYPPRPELPAPMSTALAERLAKAYRWTGTAHESREFEYITHVAPAGSMSATAADMARYMLALLNGGTLEGRTVFGPATAAAISTPMTNLPPAVGNWNAGFLERVLPGGFRGIGHSGGTLSFFSDLIVAPELDLGVFVSTNTEGGGLLSGTLASRIVERFYARARAAPAGAPELAERAERYAGAYLGTRRPHGGLEGFVFRFMALVNVSVSDTGVLLVAPGPFPRYVPAEMPDVFRPVDDAGLALAFADVEDGRAEWIVTAAQGLRRVGPAYRADVFLAVAALAAGIALVNMVSFIVRRGHPPGTRAQRRASRLRSLASLLWLGGLAAAAVFAAGALGDASSVVYDWPLRSATTFAYFVLAASLVTALLVVFLPGAWRGSPSPDAWSLWRRLRFTASVLVFAAFAVLLGLWGALAPWNV